MGGVRNDRGKGAVFRMAGEEGAAFGMAEWEGVRNEREGAQRSG